MPIDLKLSDIKDELKSLIRRNSDRGFLPYSGCNRVCHSMSAMVEDSKGLDDPLLALDIQLYILTEALKIISHADTSSGAVTDVVHECLDGITKLSDSAPNDLKQVIFNKMIKSLKNKAFQEWEEQGYLLLRIASNLVRDQKQASMVYDLFPILGTMYSGEDYPDRYVITQQMIARLDGIEASHQYQLDHIHVPELREMVVERAMSEGQYARAEQLCLEVFQREETYGGPGMWAYYLEQIYAKLGDRERHVDIVRWILRRGERSYYSRVKELYQSEGVWEQHKESVLQELSKAYMPNTYAALLAQEGEWDRLLAVVQTEPMLLEHYGKSLSVHYPAETSQAFEEHILSQAAAATDRRKYRGVCKLIRVYSSTGAKVEARDLIQRLIVKYPRRVAMVDELESLGQKLMK